MALLCKRPAVLHPHAVLLSAGRLLAVADDEPGAGVQVPLLPLALLGHVPHVPHLRDPALHQLPSHVQPGHVPPNLQPRRAGQRHGRRALLRAAAADGVGRVGRLLCCDAAGDRPRAAGLAVCLALRLVGVVLRLVLVGVLFLRALPPVAARLAHADPGRQAAAGRGGRGHGAAQPGRRARLLVPLRGGLRRAPSAQRRLAAHLRHRMVQLVLARLLPLPPLLDAHLRGRCGRRLCVRRLPAVRRLCPEALPVGDAFLGRGHRRHHRAAARAQRHNGRGPPDAAAGAGGRH
mmetsp:Transcript_5161/g.17092  ORF Transcript_5161/g.17092 Transcript_5161/m.17092 type:complete len:291 (+) Transcript_5161:1025-1897(+)